jgi:hypothetical protein
MASYPCTNDDLAAERPKILDYGVFDWTDKILEAKAFIDRTISARWYRAACKEYSVDYRVYEFDSDLLLNANEQLGLLCVYKTLQLIYQYLSKDTPEPDAFERNAKRYEKLYAVELSDVLANGLDYDWDSSGSIDNTEKLMPSMRRLKRA